MDNKSITINRTGGTAEMRDNPTHGALMNYPAGGEYYPSHLHQPQDWRLVVVKTVCALVACLVGIIIFALWKFLFCRELANLMACATIDRLTPIAIGMVLFGAIGLYAWQWIERSRNQRRIEFAEAQRTALVRDRFGNPLSAELFASIPALVQLQYSAWQYQLATDLKRDTAQWEQYGGSNSGLNTLNVSHTNNPAKVESALALPSSDVEPKVLPAALGEMEQLGIIRSSDYSLFVGYGNGLLADIVDWKWSIDGGANEAVIAACAGSPGSGKSYTVANLVAFAVRKNVQVHLYDPQRDAQNEQTLSSLCAPVVRALGPIAAEYDELLAMVRKVVRVGEDRESGRDTSRTPVLGVIDEFTGTLLDSPDAEELLRLLIVCGSKFRKFNVRWLLAGTSWKANIVGGENGTTLRSLIRFRVLHGMPPAEAAFLTTNMPREDLALIERHKIGEATVYGPNGLIKPVRIPALQPQLIQDVHLRMVPPQRQIQTDDEFLSEMMAKYADRIAPSMHYAMAEPPKNGQNGVSQHSIVHSAEDVRALVREYFADGYTYREVRAALEGRGLELDQNEFPKLRSEALGK